jgi:hypothetical protein
LNRLGDVGGLDFFGAGEIGDGAADFKDATVGRALRPNLLMAVSSSFSASSFTEQYRLISRAPIWALAWMFLF